MPKQKVRQSYMCIVELGFCSEGQVGEILDGDKGDTDLPWFKPSSRGTRAVSVTFELLNSVGSISTTANTQATALSLGRCSHLR